MKPKIYSKIFSLLAILSLLLSGTITTGIQRAAAEEPLNRIPITWLVGMGAGSFPDQITVQQQVVADFNASQNTIDLTLIVMPDTGAAENYLRESIASGNPPDIVGPIGIGGEATFHYYWSDLQPWITAQGYDLSDFDPSLLPLFASEGGGITGIPISVYPSYIYYQKDLFDQAGLAYPPHQYGQPYTDEVYGGEWDIAKLEEIATLLTKDSIGKNATDPEFDNTDIVQFGFIPQWLNAGSEAVLFGAGSFADSGGNAQIPENWRAAFEWYYTGMWEKFFIPNGPYRELISSGNQNEFDSNRVAMALTHSWFTCCLGNAVNWDIAATPSYNGVVTAQIDADAFRIMNLTQHPDEAFQVLVFLTSQAAETLNNTYGGFPARTSLQPAALTALIQRFPGVDWQVLVDSIPYGDIPNHEAGLPNNIQSLNRINEFEGLLQYTTGLNVPAELDRLKSDLNMLFSPRINAYLSENRIDTFYWPLGLALNLMVTRLDGITYSASLTPAPWQEDLTVGYANFGLGPDFILEPGQLIEITNGIDTETLIVTDLYVTSFDPIAKIVSGYNAPQAWMEVNIWTENGGMQNVSSDLDGFWQVSYDQASGPFMPWTIGDVTSWDADGDATVARINFGSIYTWPDGENIVRDTCTNYHTYTLTVDDPGTGEGVDFSETLLCTPVGDGSFGVADFPLNGYRLHEWDLITIASVHDIRTLVVPPRGSLVFDSDTDIFNGTNLPGVYVRVQPPGPWEIGRTIKTEASGEWEVDFSKLGQYGEPKVNILPGMDGSLLQFDPDGDHTDSGWHIPNPRFDVRANADQVEAWEWPLGDELTLSVGGQEFKGTVGVPSWDPNSTYVSFNLSGVYDIQPGDELTLSNGLTPKTTKVTSLAITGIDVDHELVFGIAEPSSKVDLWACPPSVDCQNRHVKANADGNWSADFAHPGTEPDEQATVNIIGGTWIDSRLWDDDSDSTMFGVNTPWLIAFPEWDYIQGFEWPVNASVHLAIDDPSTAASPDKELDKNAEPKPWDPGNPIGWVIFDNLAGYNLKAGDRVTLSVGDMSISHTILNLVVTTLDPDADIIAGTADPSATVQLWPHGFDQTAMLQATADEDGNWVADFFGLYDLAEGESGRAQIPDQNGNYTAMDWGIPVLDWLQANTDGFGDAANNGVTALESFNGQLYAGASNWNAGGQVWRLEGDGSWQSVSDPGFGNEVASPAIIDLATFRDQLYAGVGWGGSSPGQVWRSVDGITWRAVTLDGFGDSTNNAITNFIVFKGRLYAGVSNPDKSAQIWRSNTGNLGSWVQVAPDGPGIPGNVTGFTIYKNVLYAALEPPTEGGPVQVWRSSDGSAWSTVVADGFSDADNISTGGFAEFRGYLYLGTRNETTGAQLWRTRDGVHWQQVVGDGFGDAANIKIESLRVYDELLYAVAYNDQQGLQVWRTADGKSWEHILADGFMDSGNYSTLWNNATIEFAGEYLVGTWNNSGGEVWVYTQVPLPPDETSWLAAYSADLSARFWPVGSHTYHFDFEWSFPEPGTFSGQGGDFIVDAAAPLYNGYVLLRGPAEIANVGLPDAPVCEGVPLNSPRQPTRFVVGWTNDNPMNFLQALAHFGSLTASAVWDNGKTVDLIQHEIHPSTGFDWPVYICTYTLR